MEGIWRRDRGCKEQVQGLLVEALSACPAAYPSLPLVSSSRCILYFFLVIFVYDLHECLDAPAKAKVNLGQRPAQLLLSWGFMAISI